MPAPAKAAPKPSSTDILEKHGIKDVYAECGDGWADILDRLLTDLKELGWDGRLLQVKEKLGGLRFYIPKGGKRILARIARAERESTRTCEDCGNPGFHYNKGAWLYTRCGGCWTKLGGKRASKEGVERN